MSEQDVASIAAISFPGIRNVIIENMVTFLKEVNVNFNVLAIFESRSDVKNVAIKITFI